MKGAESVEAGVLRLERSSRAVSPVKYVEIRCLTEV